MKEKDVSEEVGLIERVVSINRIGKVVKGGKKIKFSALVVVGDGQGRVGVGLGKANEVPEAISKGAKRARKNIFSIPRVDSTIPFPMESKYGAARVIMRPAVAGTGVIAGGAMRAVFEAAGIQNVLTKSLGSNNPINVVNATIKGLREMASIYKVAQWRRGTKNGSKRD